MPSMFDAQRSGQAQSDKDKASAQSQPSGQMPDLSEQTSWDQLHQHTQQVVRATNNLGAKLRQMFP